MTIEGLAPFVAICGRCDGWLEWIDCPTGGWWAHEKHPADSHDAVEYFAHSATTECAEVCDHPNGTAVISPRREPAERKPKEGPKMSLYRSKPQQVEAVQWTGDNWDEVLPFGGPQGKVASVLTLGSQSGYENVKDIQLLAGKDGAQGWVPVPVGHWLVHPPSDLTDIWPVDLDYFAAKYEPVAARRPASGPGLGEITDLCLDRAVHAHINSMYVAGLGVPYDKIGDRTKRVVRDQIRDTVVFVVATVYGVMTSESEV